MRGVPDAAGNVEVGWVLRYDGEDRAVIDVQVHPLERGETDRRCTIWFADRRASGDEAQTVYVVSRPDTPGDLPG